MPKGGLQYLQPRKGPIQRDRNHPLLEVQRCQFSNQPEPRSKQRNWTWWAPLEVHIKGMDLPAEALPSKQPDQAPLQFSNQQRKHQRLDSQGMIRFCKTWQRVWRQIICMQTLKMCSYRTHPLPRWEGRIKHSKVYRMERWAWISLRIWFNSTVLLKILSKSTNTKQFSSQTTRRCQRLTTLHFCWSFTKLEKWSSKLALCQAFNQPLWAKILKVLQVGLQVETTRLKRKASTSFLLSTNTLWEEGTMKFTD